MNDEATFDASSFSRHRACLLDHAVAATFFEGDVAPARGANQANASARYPITVPSPSAPIRAGWTADVTMAAGAVATWGSHSAYN